MQILKKLLKNFLKSKPFRCFDKRAMNNMLYIKNPAVKPTENHSIPNFGAMNTVIEAMNASENRFIIIGVIVFWSA
jgi:hypothetical protein